MEKIRALARIQCTEAEVASVLGCARSNLLKFFAENPDARQTFMDGLQEGCASLRRKQFALADKNPAMLIWLGKQYLGQKDKNESVVLHRDASEMTVEELKRAIAEEMAELGPILDSDLDGTRTVN